MWPVIVACNWGFCVHGGDKKGRLRARLVASMELGPLLCGGYMHWYAGGCANLEIEFNCSEMY